MDWRRLDRGRVRGVCQGVKIHRVWFHRCQLRRPGSAPEDTPGSRLSSAVFRSHPHASQDNDLDGGDDYEGTPGRRDHCRGQSRHRGAGTRHDVRSTLGLACCRGTRSWHRIFKNVRALRTRAMACGISVARHLNRVSYETGGVEFLADQISSCICFPCKMPAQWNASLFLSGWSLFHWGGNPPGGSATSTIALIQDKQFSYPTIFGKYFLYIPRSLVIMCITFCRGKTSDEKIRK